MIEVRQTTRFRDWLRKLRDRQARTRVQAWLRRLADDNPGDVKPLGEGVLELRIDHGPGYRVYYVQRGSVLVVLMCGGTKRTQVVDIRAAKRLAKEV
jgi:putative addiction module killer protein